MSKAFRSELHWPGWRLALALEPGKRELDLATAAELKKFAGDAHFYLGDGWIGADA